MINTTLKKKRVIGFLLLAVILIAFLAFNRLPKLDAVGGDLSVITQPEVQCFQGFCVERDPGVSFLSRWWVFSITYLRLVAIGMVFAFLVAGLTETFIFPPGSGTGLSSGGIFKRTIKGLAIGPVMNLCSACIVPISTAYRRRGIGIEGSIAMVQGSATMNIPALSMVFFVFTPLLGISRLLLAVIGALVIGPLVVMTMKKSGGEEYDALPIIESEHDEDVVSWKTIITEGFLRWMKSSVIYLIRLGPIMVLTAFVSGLAVQWISASTVSTYLGNDLMGVALAATLGILINVPLLFEIPLVALMLLLGMGTAPAATLLFAAAAGGPMTFWGLSKVMPKTAILAFAGATWVLGAMGGVVVLGIGQFIWSGDSNLKISVNNTSNLVIETESLVNTSQIESSFDEDALLATTVRFKEISKTAGVDFSHYRDRTEISLGGGAAAGDYNGDGFIDIYVTNSNGANALYQNNGDGTFFDKADAAKVDDISGRGLGAAWGDYNNDGNLDLFVANFGSSRLFKNNGNGTFLDVTELAGVSDPDSTYRSSGVTWGDYNSDGYLDLLVLRHLNDVGGVNAFETNDLSGYVRPLALYKNNGDGKFTNVTHLLGDVSKYPSNVKGAGFTPMFLDYDNDADLDIYVVNDFGKKNYANVLWRNDGLDPGGEWKFTDVSVSSGTNVAIFGMGLAAGDYDNDGDLDMYITNIGGSEFLENQGDSTFVSVDNGTSRAAIIVENATDYFSIGWGTIFADFDNDGLLDLYYVAGNIDYVGSNNMLDRQPNAVLTNQGNKKFADVSARTGADDSAVGREVVAADFNGDGQIDLFVTNLGRKDGTAGVSRLFENTSNNSNNWVQVNLIGTKSNFNGIGARVNITLNDLTMTRTMGASQGHISQSLVPIHFGLGQAQSIDSIEIRWPSCIVQTIVNVDVNQALTFTEPEQEAIYPCN